MNFYLTGHQSEARSWGKYFREKDHRFAGVRERDGEHPGDRHMPVRGSDTTSRPTRNGQTGKGMRVQCIYCFCVLISTSGHDYFDAERGSCLMNTHWATVWSNRKHRALSLFSSTACCAISSSIWNSTFPGLGFESQSRQLCDVTPMTTHINQSIKFFKQIFSIDRPLQKVGRRKKTEKNALTGVRTPDLETWNLKWNWNCHSVQTTLWKKTGKAPYDCPLLHTVSQWVFIRQLALSPSK